MTALTPDYLHLFNVLGLEAICTSNRDIIFGFNSLNRQQVIQVLITKTYEGYKLVIPPFILKIMTILELEKVILRYS